MKVYRHQDEMSTVPRAHPWTESQHNPSHRYYDLKEHPELIPEVLEDFTPWASHEAIQSFYELLRGLNSPASALESNDCAFRGPRENLDPKFPKKLQCSGRLMILFRDVRLNLSKNTLAWLEEGTLLYLERLDPDNEWGVVGTTIMACHYNDLGQAGYQLLLSFFAWGDTEDEAMTNLNRVFRATTAALATLSLDAHARRYEGFRPDGEPAA